MPKLPKHFQYKIYFFYSNNINFLKYNNIFQVSNVIYLDSPTGVGFSYSKNISKYSTGDLQTASDTHAFLLKVLPITQPIITILNYNNLINLHY